MTVVMKLRVTVCWWSFLETGSTVESGQYTSTEAFKFSIPVRAVYFVKISYAKKPIIAVVTVLKITVICCIKSVG